jgi:hypothetical protein
VALVVQFVVPICRFLSFFFYLPFSVIPWSLDHYVNILPTNEIEGQQLLDLSKKNTSTLRPNRKKFFQLLILRSCTTSSNSDVFFLLCVILCPKNENDLIPAAK